MFILATVSADRYYGIWTTSSELAYAGLQVLFLRH